MKQILWKFPGSFCLCPLTRDWERGYPELSYELPKRLDLGCFHHHCELCAC